MKKNHSETSECSETQNTPMGTPLRKVFDRVTGFATSWRRNTTPRGRRVFHRDVEREEFQYANTYCLSSYYSVFVARLAIMVGENSAFLNYQFGLGLNLKFLYWLNLSIIS